MTDQYLAKSSFVILPHQFIHHFISYEMSAKSELEGVYVSGISILQLPSVTSYDF